MSQIMYFCCLLDNMTAKSQSLERVRFYLCGLEIHIYVLRGCSEKQCLGGIKIIGMGVGWLF